MEQDIIPVPLGLDEPALRGSLLQHLTYSVGKTAGTATDRDWYQALALTVRDRLVERLIRTLHQYYQDRTKRVYYLSMEYLLGRGLGNALACLGIDEETRRVLTGLNLDYERLRALEDDAGLGNGGLGRLAACLLDSMATLGLAGYGYGIRYEYGMFSQRIEDGHQVEQPENWLRYGNPWELARTEVLFPVRFGGQVDMEQDAAGRLRFHWNEAELVMAMAYDLPVPGYRNQRVNNLRLWSAKSSRDLDLQRFNAGDYAQALETKTASENLSRVLYPNDATALGRELRLRQEYFFVSASLQDILRRHLTQSSGLLDLPERVALQLNDTHPALAVAELMRLLLDEHLLDWERAWDITQRTCSYTNHTLMPEAMEVWSVAMLGRLLPRHLQIIFEINRRFLKLVEKRYPGDFDRLRRLSLVADEGERWVRMAYLAVVGSHRVNGVSELHTRLLRETLFRDFHELWPERFVNITNGITPRRWLDQANPALSRLIGAQIGPDWITDLDQLRRLEPLAGDPDFQAQFRQVKRTNQDWLGQVVRWRTGIRLLPGALFDVQAKRIHEYKRQLLCLLYAIVRYNRLRRGELANPVPRNLIFAGKAAPGYDLAKRIIKLINDVAARINGDPAVATSLRLAFVPNYDLSTAAILVPAADLSEQISTAGTEASGTGNMKMALNGALTIGTLDGANIELCRAVGPENFFPFGLGVQEVQQRRRRNQRPQTDLDALPELAEALEQIGAGYFSAGDPSRHRPVVDRLLYEDPYLVLADFGDYQRAQGAVDDLYLNPAEWTRRAILNLARMGSFSSDRTVRDYAREVWGLTQIPAAGG